MRATTAVLAIALLASAASSALAGGSGGSSGSSTRTCLRLVEPGITAIGRRFRGKTCDIAWIRTEIRTACRNGLCRGKSSSQCNRAIRVELRRKTFPENCKNASVCHPLVCSSAKRCRRRLNPSLRYPRNCPQKCVATSGCPNQLQCKPDLPHCGPGTSINKHTCQCERSSCTPQVCTSAKRCRRSVNLSLHFPRNCPQKCVASGGCPNTLDCVPDVPSCGFGSEVDPDTCQCGAPKECRRDSDCPDGGNACFMGVCTDSGVCKLATMPNCCENDATGAMADSECTLTTPLCGRSNRSPVGQGMMGNTCYKCENDRSGDWKDNGCSPEFPLCGDSDGGMIGDDDLGDKCYRCKNDKSTDARDLGCSDTSPLCVAADGGSVALGAFGEACVSAGFTCTNNMVTGVDDGCTDSKKFCNASPGQIGTECLQCLTSSDCTGGSTCAPVTCSSQGTCTVAPGSDCCVNDKTDDRTDAECTSTRPFCGASGGFPVALDQSGEVCYLCQNTKSGGSRDPGCPGVRPLCDASNGRLGDSCEVCAKDSSTGVDSGCSFSKPYCVGGSGVFGTSCVECVSNTDCGDGGACSPECNLATNTCAASTAANCCVNDKLGVSTDSECSAGAPLCGGGAGNVIANLASGEKCFVCENNKTGGSVDLGCSAGKPLCSSSFGLLGDSCEVCVNDNVTGQDSGCSGSTPVCQAAFGSYGTQCVQCDVSADCDDGTACSSVVCSSTNTCQVSTSASCCVNSQPGGGEDEQCSAATPLCGNLDGSVIPLTATGEKCFLCLNDQLSSSLRDTGCTGTTPYCLAPLNTLGSTCGICINDSDGRDTGCPVDAKNCLAASNQAGVRCVECADNTDCSSSNSCEMGVCDTSDNTCSTTALADGTACESDNIACTTDTCLAGECVNTPVNDVCGASTDDCSENVCTAGVGCVATPKQNGLACTGADDSIACTDEVCMDGVCTSVPNDILCEDGTVCTTSICSATSGCQIANANEGGACETDNLECTADICASGICTHEEDTSVCGPPAQCMQFVCLTDGSCNQVMVADGTACTPAATNDCVSTGSCMAGVCMAVTTACDDLDVCTMDTCNAELGCQFDPITAPTATCDDNVACTRDDSCTNGVCQGTPDDMLCPPTCVETGGVGVETTFTCSSTDNCVVATTTQCPCGCDGGACTAECRIPCTSEVDCNDIGTGLCGTCGADGFCDADICTSCCKFTSGNGAAKGGNCAEGCGANNCCFSLTNSCNSVPGDVVTNCISFNLAVTGCSTNADCTVAGQTCSILTDSPDTGVQPGVCV